MTATTLDRSRPYGTVHGEETDGAFYEQEGLLFDNEGNLLEHLMTPAQHEAARQRAAVRNAEEQARAAYTKAMVDAGLSAPNSDAPPGAPPVIVSEDAVPPADADFGAEKVDLEAWMRGTKKYQFFAITGAVREQFGFAASSKSSVVNFLQDKLNLPDTAIRV